MSELTYDQRREFEEQGYVILDQAVPRSLCDQAVALMESVRRGEKAVVYHTPGAADYRPVFQAHEHERLMMELAACTPVCEALAGLLGDIPMICQSMFFFRGSQSEPHQDEFFMVPDPQPLIASWFALQDVTIEDGALAVIPGTHTGPLVTAGDVAGQWWKDPQVHADYHRQVAAITDRSKQVSLTLPAGDAVLFHGRLIHLGLKPAAPDGRRYSFACHHCRTDALLDISNNGIEIRAIPLSSAS